jgi:hypothetical protein
MTNNLLGVHILLLLIPRQHLILMVCSLLRLETTFCLSNNSVAITWFPYNFVHEIFIKSGSYDAIMVTTLTLGVLLLIHTSILNSSATITNRPNLFPVTIFCQGAWYRRRIFGSQLISLLLALRLLRSSLVDSTHEQFSAIDFNLRIVKILSP